MSKSEPLKGKAVCDKDLTMENIRSAVEYWIEKHLESGCKICKNTEGCIDYLNIIEAFEDVMK